MQLKDIDPDLSSQFVFSPPLLRSRRKNKSSISQIVKEPVSKNSSCFTFRRIRGVPHAKLEKTDAPEQRAAQPNEESSTPRTTVGTGRRGRKRRLALEESTEEEAFPQGPGGSPMMLE